MIHGQPVIDADSHKCENPAIFPDYLARSFRGRLDFVRDRYGEQRFRLMDRDPATGRPDFARVFLQPDGYGKGTFRPYHPESTLGGLFNRVRLDHMDREGIDHQVVYGSITLAFNSLLDSDLCVALCRAYNDYIRDDCEPWRHRLHPVGVLPLRDPDEAVRELRRCVQELGMHAVTIPPHLPVPHPDAPDRFPTFRVPKPLSHPDFAPLLAEAERLDVAVGLHGAPGVQLAGGTSDQLDTFTLVHVFANRCTMQAALARLVFDGTLEAHPRLRLGLLEAGCGWLPDLMHSLHEHWEKRVLHFDPTVEPSAAEFLMELARERAAGRRRGILSKARGLLSLLFTPSEDAVSPETLERFRNEHPGITRDPLELLAPGRLFFSLEPDDPAPRYLSATLGPVGDRLCGLAVDYGHWDATVKGCVRAIAEEPAYSREQGVRLLSGNALAFYGARLRARMERPAPGRRPARPRPTAPPPASPA